LSRARHQHSADVQLELIFLGEVIDNLFYEGATARKGRRRKRVAAGKERRWNSIRLRLSSAPKYSTEFFAL
jgi:hypothetical protein